MKKVLYSEYEKDKFVKELKRTRYAVTSIERDFVSVFTVYYHYA